MIPYALIFSLGIKAVNMNKRGIIKLAVVNGIVFFSCAIFFFVEKGHFVGTQIFKYPPRIYYVSYALMIIFILYEIREHIVIWFRYLNLLNIATFIGRHTMWMYFWHIIMLLIFKEENDKLFYFTMVYIATIIITYIQSKSVSYLTRQISNDSIRKDIVRIFDS